MSSTLRKDDDDDDDSLELKKEEVPVLIKHANNYLSTRMKPRYNPSVCRTCKKTFPLIIYLEQHLKYHSADKPFSCNSCRKALEEKNALKCYRPPWRKSRFMAKKYCGLYVCKTCDATFRDMYNFQSHLKIHMGSKYFACNMCGKEFNRKSSLNRHKKFHLNERSFKCGDCDKAFAQKSDLSRHSETHSKTRPSHYCNQCDRMFSSRYFLLKHERKQI